MKIITPAIQKGGVGKTTTAAVLAQTAAYRGYRVLAIDLDPQGQLTTALNGRAGQGSSYNLFAGFPTVESIQDTEGGIDLIPASWNLSTITSGKGSARRLQAAVDQIKDRYDFIFIDTPPTAGELQYNALQAATDLIIPLQADIYCLQSMYQIAETAKQIQKTNRDLKVTGLIFTAYDGRSTLSRQMKGTIIDRAEALNIPYLGTIRAGVAIKEAAALQTSLYKHAPKSKPAQDYLNLFDRLAQGT